MKAEHKLLAQYITAGIIAWFLIGLGVDALLHTDFFRFIGIAVGIAGGFILARTRQESDEDPSRAKRDR